MEKQTIIRKCTFDSGHRVMNEKMKCFNLHGHTYHCELVLEFDNMREIGYPVDFKEIKRVGCQFIDDYFDHGVIVNPKDTVLIKASMELGSKMWYMSINGLGQYCNPTVENIAKEIFLAVEFLLNDPRFGLRMKEVILYETPNCYTVCPGSGVREDEKKNFFKSNWSVLEDYKKQKGVIDYDDRA